MRSNKRTKYTSKQLFDHKVLPYFLRCDLVDGDQLDESCIDGLKRFEWESENWKLIKHTVAMSDFRDSVLFVKGDSYGLRGDYSENRFAKDLDIWVSDFPSLEFLHRVILEQGYECAGKYPLTINNKSSQVVQSLFVRYTSGHGFEEGGIEIHLGDLQLSKNIYIDQSKFRKNIKLYVDDSGYYLVPDFELTVSIYRSELDTRVKLSYRDVLDFHELLHRRDESNGNCSVFDSFKQSKRYSELFSLYSELTEKYQLDLFDLSEISRYSVPSNPKESRLPRKIFGCMPTSRSIRKLLDELIDKVSVFSVSDNLDNKNLIKWLISRNQKVYGIFISLESNEFLFREVNGMLVMQSPLGTMLLGNVLAQEESEIEVINRILGKEAYL